MNNYNQITKSSIQNNFIPSNKKDESVDEIDEYYNSNNNSNYQQLNMGEQKIVKDKNYIQNQNYNQNQNQNNIQNIIPQNQIMDSHPEMGREERKDNTLSHGNRIFELQREDFFNNYVNSLGYQPNSQFQNKKQQKINFDENKNKIEREHTFNTLNSNIIDFNNDPSRNLPNTNHVQDISDRFIDNVYINDTNKNKKDIVYLNDFKEMRPASSRYGGSKKKQ